MVNVVHSSESRRVSTEFTRSYDVLCQALHVLLIQASVLFLQPLVASALNPRRDSINQLRLVSAGRIRTWWVVLALLWLRRINFRSIEVVSLHLSLTFSGRSGLIIKFVK